MGGGPMSEAPKSHDFVGPEYWADRDPIRLADKIAAAEAIDRARKALTAGAASPEALAYARFLSAVESDATLSNGAFKPFMHDDNEVRREWPHLSNLIGKESAA